MRPIQIPRQSAIRNSLLFVSVFLFIFGWKHGIFIDLISVWSLCLFFVVLIRNPHVHPGILVLVAMSLGLVVYASAVVAVNGAVDTQIALRSARALINLLGGASLAYLYWGRYGAAQLLPYVTLHLYLALTVHALLILLMFLQPDLRAFVYRMTSAASFVNINSPFLEGLRIPGLTYGLANTSVLQLGGLLLLLPVARYWRRRPLVLVGVLCGAPLLLLSLLLTGRTGLLLGILFVPAAWVLSGIRRGNTRSVGKRADRAGRSLGRVARAMATLAVVGVFVFVVVRNLPSFFYTFTLPYAEEVLEFLGQGGRTRTTEILAAGYFRPDSVAETLFGSSNLGRGDLGYIESDSGYVLMLHAIGLIGSTLLALPYLYGMRLMLALRKHARHVAVAGGFILLSTVVLHFKEIGMMTRNQWSVQCFLMCAGLLYLRHVRESPVPAERAASAGAMS